MTARGCQTSFLFGRPLGFQHNLINLKCNRPVDKSKRERVIIRIVLCGREPQCLTNPSLCGV